ncbi:hypothetical protein RHSIM_Rhsim04G0115200 [Rhododendron simsii]|uniref:CCHC-type domain-containing protein n=1 Tax=Rhododendron simsii TaxID=118357 RepID=A0A834LRJ1_RHOSS|nr:hypothetical protein RHSIM_Rhsim04G0115200 [Rhododendron simsii]
MEDPVIISLDESFEECPKNAQFILVGKILASKTLNRAAVQKILEKAWRTEKEFTISYWRDNVYGFGFQNEDDLCRIISKGPWSVMGSILILRKWDQAKPFSDLDFDFSPFWVQIHGLPLGFLNSKTGMVVAKSLGEVIAVEDPGDCGRMTNFLRVRVWLDVSKPLKKGFFLRRSKEDDIWVRFKYERLSDFCYGCGKVSHTVNECKEKRSFSAKDWVFDGSLRAEYAVVDTIQYGDKPLPRLIYPEGRRSVGDDGRACSGSAENRVANPSEDIPSPNSEVRQNQGGVEQIMMRTSPLENDTYREESNEVEDLPLGSPSSVQLKVSGTSGLKCGFVGPRCGSSSGAEAVLDGPLYYVEEPDSPRPNSGVEKAKSPEELLFKPNSPLRESYCVELGRVGKYPRTGEEGLVRAFSKALNLKRKDVGEPEREQGKRLKGSEYGEASQQELILVHLATGDKGPSRSPPRVGFGRGRGRRGGRAGRNINKGGDKIPILCDVDLVDVEVRVGEKSRESDHEGFFGPEISNAGDSIQDEEGAVVAGLEQPRVQW